ncbi:MAG: hypothetical protein ABMA64_23745 [Myxococcota bacterium]
MSDPGFVRTRWRGSPAALVVVVAAGLACSGLPTELPDLPVDLPVGTPPAVEPAPVPEVAPEPEPQATPESLFDALSAEEAVPYARPNFSCPPPTMAIKNPSGGRMRVFCATGSGVRVGPYTEWKSSELRLAGTNADGKLSGRLTRWEKGPDGPRKVGEENYTDGELAGDFATWDLAGHLLVRGRYEAGKKQGRFLESTVETFGGACYEAGEEKWRTADPAEFVTKDCRDPS